MESPILHLEGELDRDNVAEFSRRVEIISRENSRTIYIDLQKISNIDSMALGTFIYFHSLFLEAKKDFVVLNPSNMVLDILDRSGLNEVITIEIIS